MESSIGVSDIIGAVSGSVVPSGLFTFTVIFFNKVWPLRSLNLSWISKVPEMLKDSLRLLS